MPFLATLIGPDGAGSSLSAACAMPSFTNPNNLSIATGAPPAVHGICGNYFFDPDAGEEVLMNDPRFLRAPTIFAEFARDGAAVTVVTAKDKLRRLLGAGLENRAHAICFSAEKADEATTSSNGIDDVLRRVGRPLPDVYSAALSEFVLAAGVHLLRTERPSLMYLSLTDYVQHKYAPGTAEADDFYSMMDGYFAALHALGAILVITADHGMNAKSTIDGKPNVVYLQTALDTALGTGAARVILPITDPYVAHHGALGSFAFIHLAPGADIAHAQRVLEHIPEIARVLPRAQAAAEYELPADRIGDLAVVADRAAALGTEPTRHDLTALDRPLRSHGGLSEQRVPFLMNRAIAGLPSEHKLRNFDAYWVALNHVTEPIAAR